MGVDGFRLDAVPYLTEEGACNTGCPGTHAFLHEYAAHIDSILPGAYTVGEAWGNLATLMPYYPDQLTSYFGFELADSLVAAVRRGSAGGVLAGFLRLQDTLPWFRWSPLLSNHDGTRIMTLLGGDVAKARLAGTLLLTLPGLPFVYYGEEIGMTGDKPDPRLRTPMQWRAEPGLGFTRGTPWEAAQPDSFRTTVAAQQADSGSLLTLYRRLIQLRRTTPALGIGRLLSLPAGQPQVVAYLRRSGEQAVLVVANLGEQPAAGVRLGGADSLLAPGLYQARDLLGGPAAASLEVGVDGRVRDYQPFPAGLAAKSSRVLELVRR